MSLVVFGRDGQLARELRRLAPKARFLGRDEVDLNDLEAISLVLRYERPEMVINAAAWTSVDLAESHEAEANRINAEAVGVMARVCAEQGLPFVHVSTDYVFNGAPGAPFTPDDATEPLNAYGRSKLRGEQAVRAAFGVHAILRTSWVFSATGANFVKTMLRLGPERERLKVVADQIGGPTPARAIAKACLEIAKQLKKKPELTGTYHLSGREDVSWADFARAIMAEAGLACRIEDISAAEYPTPAQRPLNSRLDCSSLKQAFGIDRPDWREGLREVIKDLEG